MEMKEICKENIGFLTLRRCDRPATARCSLCQKPVCQDHGPLLSTGQIACTTCSRQPQAEERARQDANSPAGRNRYVDDTPYYSSFYYSDYHPYSVHDRFNEKDYAAFNAGAGAEGSAEAGFEGS